MAGHKQRADGAHLLRLGWKPGQMSRGLIACLHLRLRFKSCSGHLRSLISPTRVRCFFGENFLALSQKVRCPPMHWNESCASERKIVGKRERIVDSVASQPKISHHARWECGCAQGRTCGSLRT